MKIAVITDTHFGVRGDAEWMIDYQVKFFEEQFFPVLDKENIKHVFHLGDIVDRRKFINFKTLNKMNSSFILPMQERGIDMTIIPGNHDVYFKNTNKVNALDEILSKTPFIHIISEPKVIQVDDLVKFMFLPWINPENHPQALDFIQNNSADIVCGHLEMKGFEMYKGAVSTHGESVDTFKKFDEVWSGHYHHPSVQNNIRYLGAPYEMTWGDYNCPRGFSVFDTETRELTFHQNKDRLFYKIWYNDEDMELEKLLDFDASRFENKFVKIILQNKTNAYYFDKFSEKIQDVNPIRLQVVEDHKNANTLTEEEIVEEAGDTITIMEKYIDSMNVKHSEELKTMLKNLYTEASNIDTTA